MFLRFLKFILPNSIIEPLRIFLLRTDLHRFLIPFSDSNRLNEKVNLVLNDPEKLKDFRKYGEVREMCECFNQSQGNGYREHLLKEYNHIYTTNLIDISESPIGNPVVDQYGFSPNTEHHLLKAAQIRSVFGDMTADSIVEIGGGYGGLCRILLDAFNLKSYDIIDVPAMIRLQQYFLEKSLPSEAFKKITFINAFEISENFSKTWDLCISTIALSEQKKEIQMFYIDRIIKNSNAVYLINNVIFNGNLKREEFINKISQTHKLLLPVEIPSIARTHQSDYQLVGKKLLLNP